MNYTNNYHLPQWDENDRILRSDFNQMCADIESGISGVQEKSEKLSSRIDSVASAKPYRTGSYTGNDKNRTVTLGFRPSFVIVTGAKSDNNLNSWEMVSYTAMTGGGVLSESITLTNNGFTVIGDPYGTIFPNLSETGRVYNYIAFQ